MSQKQMYRNARKAAYYGEKAVRREKRGKKGVCPKCGSDDLRSYRLFRVQCKKCGWKSP